MNLSQLTMKMMLNTTERWLTNQAFRQQLLDAGPLGAGVLHKLEQAHEPLARIEHERESANAELRELGDRITRLDGTHDAMLRAGYHHCEGLIHASQDPELRARFETIQRRLYPLGIAGTRLSYVEEGGAAVVLERSLSEEEWAELDAITLGEQSLGSLVKAWIQAGHALGEAVAERSALRASLRRDGSASEKLDLRAGRQAWMQAVRGLLWAIAAEEQLQGLAESVNAALRESIELTQRRREASAQAVEGVEVVETPDDAPEASDEELEDEVLVDLDDETVDAA